MAGANLLMVLSDLYQLQLPEWVQGNKNIPSQSLQYFGMYKFEQNIKFLNNNSQDKMVTGIMKSYLQMSWQILKKLHFKWP